MYVLRTDVLVSYGVVVCPQMLNSTYISAGSYCSVTLQQWFEECKDRIALGDTLVRHHHTTHYIATTTMQSPIYHKGAATRQEASPDVCSMCGCVVVCVCR